MEGLLIALAAICIISAFALGYVLCKISGQSADDADEMAARRNDK
jgi:hypothetical protein